MAPKPIFSHTGHALSSHCEQSRYMQGNLGLRGARGQVYCESLIFNGHKAEIRLHAISANHQSTHFSIN